MKLRFCDFVVFRKTLFLDLFFICFIVLWKCFAFFYFLEELF